MKTIDPKVIRQLFILFLVSLLGTLLFINILPYLSGVLGAITLYVLLRKPMMKLVEKGWPSGLAAGVLLFLSFVIILLPLFGMALMFGNKVSKAVENSRKISATVKKGLPQLEEWLGYDITSQIDVSAISSWFASALQSLVGDTFVAAIAIFLMYFLLYFMLINRQTLRESLFKYIPMTRKNLDILGNESEAMVKANAIGIPLVALAQAIIALVGFFIFGVDNPFFWFGIVFIGAFVPFVGVGLGILPIFILALANGDPFQAWGIFLYGLIVVGSTDNLLRLFILKKLDNVHPLITLIGVIVGVPMFGFIGIIFGPLLVSLFLVVIEIYRKGYGPHQDAT